MRIGMGLDAWQARTRVLCHAGADGVDISGPMYTPRSLAESENDVLHAFMDANPIVVDGRR